LAFEKIVEQFSPLVRLRVCNRLLPGLRHIHLVKANLDELATLAATLPPQDNLFLAELHRYVVETVDKTKNIDDSRKFFFLVTRIVFLSSPSTHQGHAVSSSRHVSVTMHEEDKILQYTSPQIEQVVTQPALAIICSEPLRGPSHAKDFIDVKKICF
jgi:hypothetical protein